MRASSCRKETSRPGRKAPSFQTNLDHERGVEQCILSIRHSFERSTDDVHVGIGEERVLRDVESDISAEKLTTGPTERSHQGVSKVSGDLAALDGSSGHRKDLTSIVFTLGFCLLLNR